ncbi:MAG: phage protease [Azoarcus sp.]|nr:phage protease [Azoarcus sp.]
MDIRISSHVTALDAGDGAPEWVHLIPAGTFSGRDGRGPYVLDAQAVLRAFGEHGMPLAIDYEHQTQAAPENGLPAPAAGWIAALSARADGLWGQVEWTERARGFIAAREYRYLSPVFEYEPKSGRVVALLGAGLTNQPNLFLNALQKYGAHTKGTNMNDELLERLRYLFNLPTLADEATVVAELDKLKTRLAAPEAAAMKRAVGLPNDAALSTLLEASIHHVADADKKIAALDNVELMRIKSDYARALERLNVLEKQAAEAEIDRLVADARTAHKIAPAMEDSLRELARLDLAACTKHIESLPVLALSAQQKKPGNAMNPAKNPLLADAERRAAK